MVKNCIVASAVVFNKRGKVLLLRHKKLDTWIYPGGHVEENEHPGKAVVREVLEETGIRIKLIDTLSGLHIFNSRSKRLAQPLAILYENVRYRTEVHKHFDIVYLAEAAGGSVRSNHESDDVGWFSRKEISKLYIRFSNILDMIDDGFRLYTKLP